MRTRVLQLIHISDLHFQKGASDKVAIALAGRAMDRKARNLVEKQTWAIGMRARSGTTRSR